MTLRPQQNVCRSRFCTTPSSPVGGNNVNILNKMENEIEAKKRSGTGDFLPSGGANCSASSWKRRKPKVPGIYWLAAPVGYTPRIVKVWDDGFGELYLDAETKGWKLTSGSWKGCLWNGPLTPPSLPKA